MVAQNKRFVSILFAVPLLLLIPLIAMQFSSEVNWELIDFIVMGGLLLSVGVICELTLRKVKSKKYRVLLIVAIALIFLLVWAELAVGIFGTPFAGS